MPSTHPLRRALRLAVLVPVLALASACEDDPSGPSGPTFATMRVRFSPTGGGSSSTVNVDRGTAQASGTLGVTGNGTVTFTYLDASGGEDQVVATGTDRYESRIVATGLTAATFTRTGDHTFSVTRNATGAASITVQLFDESRSAVVLAATMPVAVQ